MKREWLTANTMYDGFPIYFRRPNIAVSEFDGLKEKYPVLVTISQNLKEVKENGLPYGSYNETLEKFDESIIQPFENNELGIIGLIETFAGKRTYFVYTSKSFNPLEFKEEIQRRFPKEIIKWTKGEDPEWSLLNGYAADFSFAF